jgi:hypothetical protein
MFAKSSHLRNRLRTYRLKLTPRQPSKKLYLLQCALSKPLLCRSQALDSWMKSEFQGAILTGVGDTGMIIKSLTDRQSIKNLTLSKLISPRHLA